MHALRHVFLAARTSFDVDDGAVRRIISIFTMIGTMILPMEVCWVGDRMNSTACWPGVVLRAEVQSNHVGSGT